jgi:hypothetical protein
MIASFYQPSTKLAQGAQREWIEKAFAARESEEPAELEVP